MRFSFIKKHSVALLSTVILTVSSSSALAADWPTRAVKLIVAFAPGSATDIVARMVAEELHAEFKQPFVVENKPGANGSIASDFVAKSEPDGYTFIVTTATVQSINPHIYSKLPYDPLKDFSAVALICSMPYLLTVDAKIPVNTVGDFLKWAGTPGNKVSYAYANGPGQIAGTLLASRAKIGAVGVSYKSSTQAMSDVAAGHVSYMFTDPASSRPFLHSGKLRALALASDKRSSLLPELPTMQEAVNMDGFDMLTWIALLGPANLPSEISEKVNITVNRALKKPEMIEKLAGVGADAMPATVSQAQSYMAEQLESWGHRVRAANIPQQ